MPTASSPNDPRSTMDPGRRAAGGAPPPLDSGVQDRLDRKDTDAPPLHAPAGEQPREAAPGHADLPAPDSALEGLGKAITSPIRSAADDDEGGQPMPGGVRP